MHVRHYLSKLIKSPPDRAMKKRPAKTPRRLALEHLEDRTLLAARLILSGTQTLLAGTNVNVSNNARTTESEMAVDINPANPLNVAGFTHDVSNLNTINVFFTRNGGNFWTRTTITNSGPNNDGFGVGTRFDPTIKFDANGNLFVGYGLSYRSGGQARTRLIVGRSADGGEHFSRFTQVEDREDISPTFGPDLPGLDKWVLTTGLDPSTGRQAVYVAYTQNVTQLHGLTNRQRIVVAGSNNNGVSFTQPVVVHDSRDSSKLFACPAVVRAASCMSRGKSKAWSRACSLSVTPSSSSATRSVFGQRQVASGMSSR